MIQRHFIDWNQLPLPATARWLADRFSGGDQLNLSNVLLVMPTSRAGYRLQELLIDIADDRDRIFIPPTVTTIGNVPELLYEPSMPLASGLAQSFAWVQALQQTPVSELRAFTRLIPDHDDLATWRTLGNLLASWHRDLAANGLMFSDMLNAGSQVEIFQEHKRWQALGAVQRRYLDVLDSAGLWDPQTARLVAIEKNECATDKQVILVGLVDLNTVFRQILSRIAPQVSALVFCDANQQDWFDEFGCLVHDKWHQRVLDIRESDILIADQPGDLARLLLSELRLLDGNYATDEITVAVPDARMLSPIGQTLAEYSIEAHDTAGVSIGHSRPFVLLELVASWLATPMFESFSKLVRHPDMYGWIVQTTGNDHWLAELDQYQNNRLPLLFSTDNSQLSFTDSDRDGKPIYANLEQVYRHILNLVLPIIGHPGTDQAERFSETESAKPIGDWSAPWREFLVSVYSGTVLDRDTAADRRTLRACQILMRSFAEMEQSGSLLSQQVVGIDALQWAMDFCRGEFIVDPASDNSVALSGWLDAPWDDTPVTLITTVNEGVIPSSEKTGLFIPDSIRTQLGLIDNHRRCSRDAWSLGLILNSRQITRLFVLRKNEEGDPVLPSRLLFTGDAKNVAVRAKRLFGDGLQLTGGREENSSFRPRTQQLVIPRPVVEAIPVNRMRVTDFKVYLMCPYRYYLTRVLKLGRLSDTAEELDGAQFGSLLHDVVENFGRSEIRDSTDAQVIETHTIDCLDRIAMARFGRMPMPAVSIQVEQARRRLRAFAKWQAAHRRDGYEIFEVEREKTRATFDVDGIPFEVRGQIDRIDVNHRKKTIGVFDYKSNDRRKGPREYHQTKQVWIDLQLPLYRYLLSEFDLPRDYEIEYGLILLARDTDKIWLELADWSEAELAEARDLAVEIMRNVRAGRFWPPSDKNVPTYLDDLAPICQTNVFQRWSEANSDKSEPGQVARPAFASCGDSEEEYEAGNPYGNRS